MPEQPKSQPRKSDETSRQLETDTVNPTASPDSNFGPLGRSIFQSLPIGIIAFDVDLKIIEDITEKANIQKQLADAENNHQGGSTFTVYLPVPAEIR